jgi:hypothetical protein
MNFFLSFDNGGKISNGGWGGIRTHGELAPTPVFKTGALNRSATHPTEIRGSMGHVPLRHLRFLTHGMRFCRYRSNGSTHSVEAACMLEYGRRRPRDTLLVRGLFLR